MTKVRIKTWEELLEIGEVDEWGDIEVKGGGNCFTENMIYLCGKILDKPEDKKTFTVDGWTIEPWMYEAIETKAMYIYEVLKFYEDESNKDEMFKVLDKGYNKTIISLAEDGFILAHNIATGCSYDLTETFNSLEMTRLRVKKI